MAPPHQNGGPISNHIGGSVYSIYPALINQNSHPRIREVPRTLGLRDFLLSDTVKVRVYTGVTHIPKGLYVTQVYHEVLEGYNILLVVTFQDATSPLYAKVSEALEPAGIARTYPKI